MNKKELEGALASAKAWLRSQNIKYRFVNSNSYSAAWPSDNLVRINYKDLSLDQFWSMVLHEACHIFCYRNKKYYIYHSDTDSLTPKQTEIFKKTALRAERYVDNMASEIFELLGLSGEYHFSYFSKQDIDFLRTYVRSIDEN